MTFWPRYLYGFLHAVKNLLKKGKDYQERKELALSKIRIVRYPIILCKKGKYPPPILPAVHIDPYQFQDHRHRV